MQLLLLIPAEHYEHKAIRNAAERLHETMAEVERAATEDVDYLGVSPIHPTPTKPDTGDAWGVDGLVRVRRCSRHPLVAIGGLHSGNAGAAVEAGADAIAVVAAVCAAPDVRRAAAELVAEIDAAARTRS